MLLDGVESCDTGVLPRSLEQMNEHTSMSDVIQAMIDSVPESDTKAKKVASLRLAQEEVGYMMLESLLRVDFTDVLKACPLVVPAVLLDVKRFALGIHWQKAGTFLAEMKRVATPWAVCSLALHSPTAPNAVLTSTADCALVACLRCVAPATAPKTGSGQPTVGHGGASAGPAGAGIALLPPHPSH